LESLDDSQFKTVFNHKQQSIALLDLLPITDPHGIAINHIPSI